MKSKQGKMLKFDLTDQQMEEISQRSSETLAGIVATSRILGALKAEAKFAMYELMKRRVKEGDQYDYETEITTIIKEAQVDIKLPSVSELKRKYIENAIYSLLTQKDEADSSDDGPEEEPKEIEFSEKQQQDLQDVLEQLVNITDGANQ